MFYQRKLENKFSLSTGSKVKIIVDGGQIILKPRTVADELQELVLDDIARDGKPVNEATIKEYQVKLNKALDNLVAEAECAYNKKEYMSLADLKKENEHV